MKVKTTLLMSLVALVLLASSGLASAAPLPSAQPTAQVAPASPAAPQLPAFLATPTPSAPVSLATAPFGGSAIICPIQPPVCPGHICLRYGCVLCCT